MELTDSVMVQLPFAGITAFVKETVLPLALSDFEAPVQVVVAAGELAIVNPLIRDVVKADCVSA